MKTVSLTLNVNGAEVTTTVEPRDTLEERIHGVEHRLLPEVVRDLCLAAH